MTRTTPRIRGRRDLAARLLLPGPRPSGLRDPAGYVTHDARWFVAIEGGFAWELAGPFFQVCARHFGGRHFAGYWDS
jgi:hypothetical protein